MSNGKIVTKYHNNKKYKCPYCEIRLERDKLTDHIQKNHEDMIPPDYTAARVAFNTINKKDSGSCIICKEETKWNETKRRYERICDNKKCMEQYKEIVATRLMNARGVTKEEMLRDPEFQNKMLNNRKISGTYKFADGGKISYVGSYERKFLEFMDVFLRVQSKDIQAPGPTIEYYYQGKKHFWITDFYYIPYNLVLDIKDGGKNPNNRDMQSYRSKQIEKEKAIREGDRYNYLRLTDNQFDQLIEMMLELKETMIDLDTHSLISYKPIVKINESTEEDKFKDRLVKKGDYHYTAAIDVITKKLENLISQYSMDPLIKHSKATLKVETKKSSVQGTNVEYTICSDSEQVQTRIMPIIDKIVLDLKSDLVLNDFVSEVYASTNPAYPIKIFFQLDSEKVDMRPISMSLESATDTITNLVFDMGSVLIGGDMRQEMINDDRIPNRYVDDLIQYYWQAENQISETATKIDCRTVMEHITPGEMGRYVPYVLEDSVKCYKPFPYTEAMLRNLKDQGFKLWYLSNWGKWHCEAVMESGAFDFLKYFDGGIFSYQVGYQKPDKRIYQEFFKKFNINPETACFYDDNIENIEAGRRLGMAGIEFTQTVCDCLVNALTSDAIPVTEHGTLYKAFVITHKLRKYTKQMIGQPLTNIGDVCKHHGIPGFEKLIYDKDLDLDDLMYLRRDLDVGLSNFRQARERLEKCVTLGECPETIKYYNGIKKMYIDKGVTVKDIDLTIQYYTGFKKKLNDRIKEVRKQRNSNHENATGNAMVGGNMPESIYLVNYTKKNAFSGEDEDCIAIHKKGNPYIYTFDSIESKANTMSEFVDTITNEGTNLITLEFVGESICDFKHIVENACSGLDVYKMLTGDTVSNINDIILDPAFVLSDIDLLDQTIQIKDIIMKEAYSLIDEPKCEIPVLESYTEGRPFNYYSDIDGFFIKNEITGERSASYSSVDNIPTIVHDRYSKMY